MKLENVKKLLMSVMLVFGLSLIAYQSAEPGDIRHNSTFDPGIKKKEKRNNYSSHSSRRYDHPQTGHYGYYYDHHNHYKHPYKHRRNPQYRYRYKKQYRFDHPVHRSYELRNGLSSQLHNVSPFNKHRRDFRHRYHDRHHHNHHDDFHR